MLFHDDDLLHPKYLEYALNLLNKYDDISVITTRYTEFWNDNLPDFLVRRHEKQDTSLSTNSPTYKHLVNWVACFYNAIQPKFLTITWFLFQKKAKVFYRSFYKTFTK